MADVWPSQLSVRNPSRLAQSSAWFYARIFFLKMHTVPPSGFKGINQKWLWWGIVFLCIILFKDAFTIIRDCSEALQNWKKLLALLDCFGGCMVKLSHHEWLIRYHEEFGVLCLGRFWLFDLCNCRELRHSLYEYVVIMICEECFW